MVHDWSATRSSDGTNYSAYISISRPRPRPVQSTVSYITSCANDDQLKKSRIEERGHGTETPSLRESGQRIGRQRILYTMVKGEAVLAKEGT